MINALMGKPYRLGAQGPDAFDCYSTATWLQERLWRRSMPEFGMPAEAGRYAMAAAIAVHPERKRWVEIDAHVDGAIVTMARNSCGYHLGTFVIEDGGLIIHALEGTGVIADTLASLKSVGWRRFRFHIPQ